jgi:type IV pilus assembly protein PilA
MPGTAGASSAVRRLGALMSPVPMCLATREDGRGLRGVLQGKSLRGLSRGFSLIELMIVVAILAILAMIAIPKFADMVRKAKEASVKGHLGSLRSAVTLYYAENEHHPFQDLGGSIDLKNVLTPRYMDSIPYLRLPDVYSNPVAAWGTENARHIPQNAIYSLDIPVAYYARWSPYGTSIDEGITGVYVFCFHTDIRGQWISMW